MRGRVPLPLCQTAPKRRRSDRTTLSPGCQRESKVGSDQGKHSVPPGASPPRVACRVWRAYPCALPQRQGPAAPLPPPTGASAGPHPFTQGKAHEAPLPAECSQARQAPRLSPSHVDARRTSDSLRPSAKGTLEAVGLTGCDPPDSVAKPFVASPPVAFGRAAGRFGSVGPRPARNLALQWVSRSRNGRARRS